MKVEINEDENVSLKDIRETFYRLRDFELSHLWQRSIVLSAFMLGCFTVFGNIVGSDKGCCNTEDYLLMCVVSTVGIIISVLWIAMGKASKTWYEVYELSIGYVEKELGITYPLRMGNFAEIKRFDKDISNCLFSCKSGRFSPSKINIAIGIVAFCVWCACFIFSTFNSIGYEKLTDNNGIVLSNLVAICFIFCLIALSCIKSIVWAVLLSFLVVPFLFGMDYSIIIDFCKDKTCIIPVCCIAIVVLFIILVVKGCFLESSTLKINDTEDSETNQKQFHKFIDWLYSQKYDSFFKCYDKMK